MGDARTKKCVREGGGAAGVVGGVIDMWDPDRDVHVGW